MKVLVERFFFYVRGLASTFFLYAFAFSSDMSTFLLKVYWCPVFDDISIKKSFALILIVASDDVELENFP